PDDSVKAGQLVRISPMQQFVDEATIFKTGQHTKMISGQSSIRTNNDIPSAVAETFNYKPNTKPRSILIEGDHIEISRYNDDNKLYLQLCATTDSGGNTLNADIKNVEIIEDLLFYVPTAINIRTPGNDEFYPKGSGIDLLSYEMSVFDRWGEEIFHTNDFYEHWQGRYNQNRGDYVPQGVYAWLITLKDKYGKDHTYTGYVTVFK
ncbi:MAG TPA: gliding motility-associated C-terminal domain-containing protein, partial [Prolixibacteraceae bacterium]|nr:gliding motility-associated C-terminal domain-containing protein [Prolixibacteraceae bacterium]